MQGSLESSKEPHTKKAKKIRLKEKSVTIRQMGANVEGPREGILRLKISIIILSARTSTHSSVMRASSDHAI